jgi:hypothetical protein
MRRPSRAGLSLVLAFCAGSPLAAQNLESIGREKPFSFSGGISLGQIFYASDAIARRRDPYSYIASANLNLSVYEWTIPLAFTLSNKHRSFSQPFNQYSVSPSWKWITARAGYTSASFSPYTVNGHIFLGGALDLAPEGNWKLSALYGQFLKAVEHDTATAPATSPSYQRMGYGLKAAYDNGRDFVHLVLFQAEDDRNSIAAIPDSLGIKPQQNLVLSLAAGKTVRQHFVVKAEIATSAITKDTRMAKTHHDHPLARSDFWFVSRLSSAYYQALKTSVAYQNNTWMLAIALEHIDPGYRTLGAYYFNNDLENITINGSASLLQNKLAFAASAGVQRDNLDKTKISTMRRLVGSANINYTPSRKLNLAVAYSSFQTYTNIRSKFEAINQLTPFENLDTLNFTQISKSASFSGMYTLPGTENKRQHVNLHISLQNAAEEQGRTVQKDGSRFLNISSAYAIAFVPLNLNVSLAFNATLNDGPFTHTRMIGPTASVARAFLQRRLRTTVASSYNRTYSNGVNMHAVLNQRISGVFSLRNKHNLTIGTVIVSRFMESKEENKSFTEFTATVGYSYSFGRRGG